MLYNDRDGSQCWVILQHNQRQNTQEYRVKVAFKKCELEHLNEYKMSVIRDMSETLSHI